MVLINQLVNGLAQGSTYALLALGFALIFGTLRLITFAHGEVFMFGAFAGFTIMKLSNGNIYLGLAAGIIVSGLLGIIIERVAYRYLRDASHVSPLLVTVGFTLILINVAQLIWGSETHSVKNLTFGEFRFFGIYISHSQLFVFCVTFALLIIMQLLIYRTKIGRAIRATAQDYEAALVMGININLVFMMTFALGSVLGGIAGVLVGAYYNAFYPSMGTMAGLKAFSACVFGGLTSLPGAVLAGFFLGIVENLSIAYIASGYRDVFAFGILIFILIFRPKGILGKEI